MEWPVTEVQNRENVQCRDCDGELLDDVLDHHAIYCSKKMLVLSGTEMYYTNTP